MKKTRFIDSGEIHNRGYASDPAYRKAYDELEDEYVIKHMTMKDPAHPGELVRATLEELGISVADAAKQLGITRQELHNLIAGRSAVSPEIALRLEAGLGSTAVTWLRMQVNYDLAQIKCAPCVNVKRIVPEAH